MLYKKDKAILRVSRGEGSVNIGPLRGTIDRIVVIPLESGFSGNVIYDLTIRDEQRDEIFFRKNIRNKVFINEAIPVGKSCEENIEVSITNSSYNMDFSTVILTKEK